MFFHEHAAAAGAAAQTAVFGAGRFQDGQTGHVFQCSTRCFVLVVVATQITGIVIRHGFLRELRTVYLQTSGVDELLDELRVVDDLGVEAVLRVFVLETVEAMRTRGHDLLHVVALEGLHVGLCQHVGQVLITCAARDVARTVLLRSEDAEVHAGYLHEFGKGLGGLLCTLVVGTGTADPEEHFHRGVFGRRLDAHSVGPVGTVGLTESAPRHGIGFHVAVDVRQQG